MSVLQQRDRASDKESPETEVKDVIVPPCDRYSDEPPLETYLHLQQMMLLIKCLEWLWQDRDDFFATGNQTIYYSANQRKSEDFRGPDFFVVLNTRRQPRKSWTVWEEDGKYPNLIVELLSASTAQVDRELKKQIYQDIFRTPDYFWFDPDSLEFAGFHLSDGSYHPLEANPRGHLWSEQLQLFLGIDNRQLRFFTPEGELVPTPEEAAKLAQQEVNRERQERELAQQEIDRLSQKLRELGIDPNRL
ncbi:Uma2 family endonuclease [Oxynema aestuarii]|uniref:Uma2 family endonuclease n=1 Tax=Oxynema aestuarii AP17 TaxID=2064643 RepID=A0A6H1U465_9CYAN|nr:Uma2 family endonuclease [Oxynema aestuarii]QIZ73662.1 Uma2 family endonuclease [Oxynema aestuarii AP17]